MPLSSGNNQKAISSNINELENTGKYHHKQAVAIALSKAKDAEDDDSPLELTMDNHASARGYDDNGWAEIKGNPLSKVGVFPYSGAQIDDDLDPNRIYMVYRPEEELSSPDTIQSFKLLPWTDEHTMLGKGQTPAEVKGVQGVIGEDIYFEDGYLKGNLKVFSDKLADLIDSGKKELSIGYRCSYEMNPGVFDGEHYDFIQRKIRGNHLALVDEGRSGHDVAVLDHFKITFDSKELKMPDEYKEDGDMSKPADGAKDEGEMDLAECREMLKAIAARLDALSDTNEEKYVSNEEAEAINLSENAVEDEDPADFVNKADVTDADEDEDKDDKEDKADKKDDGKAMDSAMKRVLKEISQRDDLALKLSRHIGVFDHKDKTLAEVACYGVKQLGLPCKRGHEESALAGFLMGKRVNSPAAVAQDSKRSCNQIDAYINGSK